MTLLDKFNLLTGQDGLGQDLDTISALTLTDDYIDRLAGSMLQGGKQLFVHVGEITTAVSSATVGATMEVRVLGYADGYAPGENAGIVGSAANAGDVVTLTNHGLQNGQWIKITTAGTSGYLTAEDYFVINKTANTFQLSTSNGGSAAPVTGDSSVTFTVAPIVIGSSGYLPHACFSVGSTVTVAINPPQFQSAIPTPRYYVAGFAPSATLDGGVVKAWISADGGAGGKVHHATGAPMPAWNP